MRGGLPEGHPRAVHRADECGLRAREPPAWSPAAPDGRGRGRMIVKNRLAAVLAERGLSARDLAMLTGLSERVVRRCLRPSGNPFLDVALRIALALDLPVAALYRLDASPS